MGEHLEGQREAATRAQITSIALGLALPNPPASPPEMFPKGW